MKVRTRNNRKRCVKKNREIIGFIFLFLCSFFFKKSTTYSRGGFYNGIGTLTSVGTYTYDVNGNLTQGTNTYVYDAEDQLIQISAGSNTIAQYEYDERGLRTKKTAGSLTEHYYYDHGRLSYITDGSNNLKYFFTRDTRGNLLNMIDRTASPHRTYWYVLDARQNVLGLVDGSGQLVVNYQYSGFGEITAGTGTITTGDGRLLRDANPFRYASYQYDQESGLYYLKSRYYIPFMGRFLTRDIIPSDNLYVYCRNNPINFVDPEGDEALTLGIAGLGAIGPVGWVIIGVGIIVIGISVYFAANIPKEKAQRKRRMINIRSQGQVVNLKRKN